MADMKAKYPKELAGLDWSNWKDARLQLRALVLMDRDLCSQIKNTKTEKDRLLMCLAAYNGGRAGLESDRSSCRAKPGCDPGVWYGNVELTSLKSKVAMTGYGGQSPFSINRGYPKTIDQIRQKRYVVLNKD